MKKASPSIRVIALSLTAFSMAFGPQTLQAQRSRDGASDILKQGEIPPSPSEYFQKQVKEAGQNPQYKAPNDKQQAASVGPSDKTIEGAVATHRKMISELRKINFKGGVTEYSDRVPHLDEADFIQLGMFVNHTRACADIHEVMTVAQKHLPKMETEKYEYAGDLSKPFESVAWIAKKPTDTAVIITDKLFGMDYRYQWVKGGWYLDLKDWFSQPAFRQTQSAWGSVIQSKSIVVQKIEEGRLTTHQAILDAMIPIRK